MESQRAESRAAAVSVSALVCGGGVVADTVTETVAESAARSLADREGRIAIVEAVRARMRVHVLVKLCALDVRTFERDDVDALGDDLDAKIVKGKPAWKTIASFWTSGDEHVRGGGERQKRQLRTRKDKPCADVKSPLRGDKKATQYLLSVGVLVVRHVHAGVPSFHSHRPARGGTRRACLAHSHEPSRLPSRCCPRPG